MKITQGPWRDGHDSATLFVADMTIGYIGRDGDIGLTRCPMCKLENYHMVVSLGGCAFCGFNLNGLKTTHDDGSVTWEKMKGLDDE